ncbi:hypothetical protein FRC01_011322 [Tulasnella sp. 417]|nr:hypothetical protein FRC01_011322 [Tulasnella sp. 417]
MDGAYQGTGYGAPTHWIAPFSHAPSDSRAHNIANFPPNYQLPFYNGPFQATASMASGASGLAGTGVVPPSPFPLLPNVSLAPKSRPLRISNPTTGKAVIPQSPDPVTRARAVASPQPVRPDSERPLTKKERKQQAKLEAEKKRQEDEESHRLRTEEEESGRGSKWGGGLSGASGTGRKEKPPKKSATRGEGEFRIKAMEQNLAALDKNERDDQQRQEMSDNTEDLRMMGEEMNAKFASKAKGKRKAKGETVPPSFLSSTVPDSPPTPVATPLIPEDPWNDVDRYQAEAQRSISTKVSDRRTGKAVVLRSPDPATAGVVQAIQPLRPPNRKERKMLARLEAEEEMRAETESREEDAKSVVEEDLLRKEGNWIQREKEEQESKEREDTQAQADEEHRFAKAAKAIIRAERRKEAEAKAKVEEEQRLVRLAEEAVARFWAKSQEAAPPVELPSEPGFTSTQRPSSTLKLPRKWDSVWRIDDLDRVVYPQGIQRPSAKLDNGRMMPSGKYKHVYNREFLMQFMRVFKEKPEFASNLEGLGVERGDETYQVNNPGPKQSSRAKGRRGGATSGSLAAPSSPESTGLGLTGFPGRISRPPPTTSQERFMVPQRRVERIPAFRATSPGLEPEIAPPSPDGQDSSIARGGPEDEDLASDDLVEQVEKAPKRKMTEAADYHALNAILELSQQMKMLLQEMKDLKDEVRELRTEATDKDSGERSKSPHPEGPAPKAARTATATQQ